MKRLALNSLAMSAGSIVANALTAVAYGVVARLIGPARFGEVVAGFGLAVIVVSVVDFGINNWTVREMVRLGSPVPYSRTLGVKAILGTGLACAWLLTSGLASLVSSHALPFLPFAIYILFAVVANTLAIPFRVEERFGRVALSAVTEKVAVLVLLAVFVATNRLDGFTFSLALGFGPVMAGAQLALGLPRRFLAVPRTRPRDVVAMWRESKHFGLTGVASQVLRADVAIVAAIAGVTAAGIYAAPSRITAALLVLPAAASVTLFSRAARQNWSAVAELRSVILVMILLTLPALVLIYLEAPAWVRTALGSNYAASVPVLRILLLVVLINTVNQPLVAALQARGDDAYVALTLWISAGVGLAAVASGAALSGASGAAFGAVAMQAVVLVAVTVRAGSKLAGLRAGDLPSKAIKTISPVELE